MRRLSMLAFVLVLGVMLVGSAIGADQAKDTQALVEKGVAMVKAKGVDATLKAIGDKKGPFVKGDLYLFAGPLDKTTLSAHPMKPALAGKDLSKTKDKATDPKKAKLLFVDFVKVAKGSGKGWVEYWWPKPGATKPSLKRTYIMRVPGQNLYIAAGYYK
ncbi:cache domain-containing protein [Thermodesulfobacteriota bacterium]